ncbi:MAG: hypothetical protein IKC51_08400 [Myxococcaceae bacterium]|nr:hypothetical protein [Myxococcaceae bacterium]
MRHHSPAISANACRARAASLPWLGMIAVALALSLSPGFALAEPAAKPPGQSVVTDGTRLAFLAGYRYWPQGKFENSATGAGYLLERRALGGPQFAFDFGYRVSRNWDVAIEMSFTWESIDFVGGATSHSSLPLMFVGRFLPWPGRFDPFVGIGAGYVLNFYSGGRLGYLESHSMGAMAGISFFYALTKRASLIAELRFTYAVSEMSEPFRSRMSGGLALLVGAQWSFAPANQSLL